MPLLPPQQQNPPRDECPSLGLGLGGLASDAQGLSFGATNCGRTITRSIVTPVKGLLYAESAQSSLGLEMGKGFPCQPLSKENLLALKGTDPRAWV